MKELLTLSLTGVFAMLAEMFNLRKIAFPLVIFGLAMTASWAVIDWNMNEMPFTDNGKPSYLLFDNYALAFIALMCSVGILWFAMADDVLDGKKSQIDNVALVVFSMVGALVMVSFTNLVMLFLGIEILSVSLYVLAASDKTSISSNEAGFKYFLMGAFASGFLLFGIALIYGATGSFDLLAIRNASINLVNLTADGRASFLALGVLMLLIGLGFKVGAAPFHFWAPDVYTGSPMHVTAFMATIVKTAAFAAFFRTFTLGLAAYHESITPILTAMVLLTLLIGNIVAAAQTNVKRMLAFSSISHAGYLLMAILCLSGNSDNAIFYYATAYSVATIVAFSVLYIINKSKGNTEISAFDGLGRTNPLLAGALLIALLSMAGIPPLAGFLGKYYILSNAIQAGYIYLVIYAIVLSLVGVYYYFKVIIAMFNNTDATGEKLAISPLQMMVLAIGTILLFALGIFPNYIANAFV